MRSLALALSALAVFSGLTLALLSTSHIVKSKDQERKIVAQAAAIEALNKKGDDVLHKMAAEINDHGVQPDIFRTRNVEYEEIVRQLDQQRKQMASLLDTYKNQPQVPSPYIGIATAMVGAIGTIFTVVFSWRTDRRNANESALRMIQMQQQITDLQRKLDDYQKPDTATESRIILP